MYEIGKTYTLANGEQWQVAGYVSRGDGIMAIGNCIDGGCAGMEWREWVSTFNRSEAEVWRQIKSLPIDWDAKRTLGETGCYPENVLEVVGITHDNWRKKIGKSPDYSLAKKLRGGRALKSSCPFAE